MDVVGSEMSVGRKDSSSVLGPRLGVDSEAEL